MVGQILRASKQPLVHVCIACHVVQRTDRRGGETRDQNDKLTQSYSHVERQKDFDQEKMTMCIYFNRTPCIGEWSHPFCSWPQVGRLMGPKPVVGEDQTGFSPDDRNKL